MSKYNCFLVSSNYLLILMIDRTVIIIIVFKLAFNLVNSKRRITKEKKISMRRCCYFVGDSAANLFTSSRTGRESCIS